MCYHYHGDFPVHTEIRSNRQQIDDLSHIGLETGRYCLLKELAVILRYPDKSNSHSPVYDLLIRDVDVGPDNLRLDRQGVLIGSINGQAKVLPQRQGLMAAYECTADTDILCFCLYGPSRGLHLDRQSDIDSPMLPLLLLNCLGQLDCCTSSLVGTHSSLEIAADRLDE